MKCKHVFSLGFLVFLVACGPSTQLTKSWTDPDINASNWKPFKKVLVLALIKDEGTRRIAEDKMAAQLPGRAVQSYSYLTTADTDDAKVIARMISDGFDGLVVMQLANVNKTETYVPGTMYGGWRGGWYGGGYGGVYGSPGYVETDQTYNITTNVYSVSPEKLLWSGTTSSLNPSKLSGTLDDIIATIKAQLQKEGLVAAAK
jgi:hypothetical protein